MTLNRYETARAAARDYGVPDAFPPTLYNGEADAETQAIAEALLENTGRISAAVFRGRVARRQFFDTFIQGEDWLIT